MRSAAFGESPAEQIVRVMAERGFAPSNTYNAHYIEFVKVYADAHGRIARAVAQVERPGANPFGAVRLSGFNVIVQAHVGATVEEVAERAPPVMQEDLMGIVAAFEQPDTRAGLAVEECGKCGSKVAEYFVIEGQVRCRPCRETE